MDHQHVVPEVGESAPFHFTSQWVIPSGPATVWDVVADIPSWATWWPGVRWVQLLEQGRGEGGNGTRAVVAVASPLGYGLTFTIAIHHAVRPDRAQIMVTGDLRGRGSWEAEPIGSGAEVELNRATRVTLTWCVVTRRRLVRVLRVAAPAAHAVVMDGGRRGLLRLLAQKDFR